MNFKKFQKKPIKHMEFKTNKLKFGVCGLRSLENAEISEAQFLTLKKTVSSFLKKNLKMWFRYSTLWPKTLKPLGSRMGSGKSAIAYNVLKIKKGLIFAEWSYLNFDQNYKLATQLLAKLSFRAVILKRGL